MSEPTTSKAPQELLVDRAHWVEQIVCVHLTDADDVEMDGQ